MPNIQSQSLVILRGYFPLPRYKVHCESVHGGVHGGEHYLAGVISEDSLKRFFLLNLETIGNVTLETALAPIIRVAREYFK